MLKTPLVIIGAAGTGRGALDIAEQMCIRGAAFDILGVADDDPSEIDLSRLEHRMVPYLGRVDETLAYAPTNCKFSIAVGWPKARKSIAQRIESAGCSVTTLVHPNAIVGSQASLGDGSIVFGGVHISTNATLRRFSIVGANATIGHDSILDEFVTVNPGASIAGECIIKDGVLVGTRAAILQGLSVDSRSTIGAAALVTKNVPMDVIVKGVPGRWEDPL